MKNAREAEEKDSGKRRFDSHIIRCPSLGGEVPFLYCRKVNQGYPCHRLPLCWGERIDCLGYIQRFYTSEEIDKYFIQPKTPGRLGYIFNQLEKVKNQLGKVKKMKEKGLDKEELIKLIKGQARGGKITCAKAWELADQFSCPKEEMGELLNELKIKIIHCQLGCF